MANQRNREEVINVHLAALISTYGVESEAETIRVHGKHRPDVYFKLRGLRVVIEGKCGDVANADKVVFRDACKRVRDSVAHIAVAVVYPRNLRTMQQGKIPNALRTATLRFLIVNETLKGSDWFERR